MSLIYRPPFWWRNAKAQRNPCAHADHRPRPETRLPVQPIRHVFINPQQDSEDGYTYCLAVLPRDPTWSISTIPITGNTEIDARAIEIAEQWRWIVLRGRGNALFTFTSEIALTTRELYNRMISWGGIVTRCFNRQQLAEEEKLKANGYRVVPRRMTTLEAEEGLLQAEVKASPFTDD